MQCLVFLHGWGCDQNTMLGMANEFKTYKCFLFCLHSIEKERVLTIDDYAVCVIDELLKAGVTKAVFVVHSFGGRVIAKIWQHYPKIVEKIIFLNSAGIKPRFSMKKYLKIKKFKIMRKLGFDVSKFGSSDYKKLLPSQKQTFINIINERLEHIYKHINVPVLIIAGENDKETPVYMARRLNRLIKNSYLHVIKDCGHYSFFDRPSEVILLAQFFLSC